MQYPTKNSGFCLENQEIVNCCFKPVSQQLKIDFRLDTSSKNYDASKGEELAQTADGKVGDYNDLKDKLQKFMLNTFFLDRIQIAKIVQHSPRVEWISKVLQAHIL